jgi:hypothetical protein
MHFPHPMPPHRSARIQVHHLTPAFVRLEDGRYRRGKLRTISLTGGLLRLQQAYLPGTLVEVVFDSPNGPVLGIAELLTPVSETLKCLQPFKFIMIEDDDYRRLSLLIEASRPRADAAAAAAVNSRKPAFPDPQI